MGNCLRPVQHVKNEEKTEAPLQLHPRLSLKEEWLQLLLISELSRTTSVLNKLTHHTHPSFTQIQKDIDRTYPLQPQFNSPQNKNTFKELLQMIALYYPRLGYIQGMNFIAGYLVLVGMNKIQAFNAFRSILFHPQLMLIGIYEDDFPLVKVYCAVFWSLFEEQSPDFAKKVRELNLPDELWIFQWFICLFIYSFPRSYVSEILTFIWREKEFACIRLALGLVKLLQLTIEGKASFQDEFIECIQMIKDQNYVRNKAPLQKLLKKASEVDKKDVQSHFRKITIKNRFSQYFTSSESEKKVLYEEIMAETQRDRKEYYNLVSKGQAANRVRNSSITIIDDIEQKRMERYYGKIYNSLSMKVMNQSFLKFQRRYSLSEQLQNNAILTESLYQK